MITISVLHSEGTTVSLLHHFRTKLLKYSFDVARYLIGSQVAQVAAATHISYYAISTIFGLQPKATTVSLLHHSEPSRSNISSMVSSIRLDLKQPKLLLKHIFLTIRLLRISYAPKIYCSFFVIPFSIDVIKIGLVLKQPKTLP